jgi:hypothetical protein
MIWITTYPGSLKPDARSRSPLRALIEFCDVVLPDQMGVHLLPFSPSDGDGGFAQRDWYSVDEAFGNWQDIEEISSRRRLIVDGVYNHVGINHAIAQRFLKSPSANSNLVYAFRRNETFSTIRSPRGLPVVRLHNVGGERWCLWQTFGSCQVDIRLDDPLIQDELRQHLRFLRLRGVWGVRLDAVAYYGKPLGQGEAQLHHPQARRLARLVASLVREQGMFAVAQLDCDEFGAPYFPAGEYDIPIVDYSYAAHLAYAVIMCDVREFARHVTEADGLGVTLVRAPRTHDGILLRSGMLQARLVSELTTVARRLGVPSRIIGGSAYELNCTLPYLFSRDVDTSQGWHRIEIAIAVSGFISGWCFLYLPLLLNYFPEWEGSQANIAGDDPRSLNRQPIPAKVWRRFLRSSRCKDVRALLSYLASVGDGGHVTCFPSAEAPAEFKGRVLTVDCASHEVLLAANVDASRCIDVGSSVRGRLQLGRRVSGRTLGPLGFGFWEY